jgi:hypothetical protein
MWTMTRVLLAVATVIALESGGVPGGAGTFSDAALKRAVAADPSSGKTEGGDAAEKKPTLSFKKVIKNIQRRACKSRPPSHAPPSSWPARGQSAISICS